MRLFLTNLGEIKIFFSFFPNVISSPLKSFCHNKFNFLAWNWKTFTTQFTLDIIQNIIQNTVPLSERQMSKPMHNSFKK